MIFFWTSNFDELIIFKLWKSSLACQLFFYLSFLANFKLDTAKICQSQPIYTSRAQFNVFTLHFSILKYNAWIREDSKWSRSSGKGITATLFQYVSANILKLYRCVLLRHAKVKVLNWVRVLLIVSAIIIVKSKIFHLFFSTSQIVFGSIVENFIF